jgi:hypothetical protein
MKIRLCSAGVTLSIKGQSEILTKPHQVKAVIEELQKAQSLLIERLERLSEESIHAIWECS